jgi:hypothetical protein
MKRLALALLLFAAPALAQDPNYDTSRSPKAPMAPTVSFSDAPIWQRVPGTTVSTLGPEQRKEFDLFGLYNEFYMYADGYWYKAKLVNGPWDAIASAPSEFHMVPKSYWVHYPKGWDESRAVVNAGADTVWTPPAKFESVPNWRLVPGSSRVYWISGTKHPGYDLFRSTSKYYTYQGGVWYMATKVNGPYKRISPSKVPSSFKSVNEKYWVNYPAEWKTP